MKESEWQSINISDFEKYITIHRSAGFVWSGARFLIRKLREKGWIDLEHGADFDEYIILPDYSIRLLELFRNFTAPTLQTIFKKFYLARQRWANQAFPNHFKRQNVNS